MHVASIAYHALKTSHVCVCLCPPFVPPPPPTGFASSGLASGGKTAPQEIIPIDARPWVINGIAANDEGPKPSGSKQIEGTHSLPHGRPSVYLRHDLSMMKDENKPIVIAPEVKLKMLTSRGKLYLLLEDANSGPAAKALMLFSTVIILCFILVMMVESIEDVEKEVHKDVWRVLEISFTAIFTFEYLIRLSVCNAFGTKTIIGFLATPANICDIVAVLPFYIEESFASGDSKSLRLFRMVRLMRVARLSRLARLSKKYPLVGPVMLCLIVIWGIYMKERK